MGGSAPRELILLADDEGNSVTVRVLGAGLEAEIEVRTPFVSGRIDLVLRTSMLESWAEALNKLDAAQDVAWMEMSNGPSLFIQLSGERDCPEVAWRTSRGRWSPCGYRSFLRTTGLPTIGNVCSK